MHTEHLLIRVTPTAQPTVRNNNFRKSSSHCRGRGNLKRLYSGNGWHTPGFNHYGNVRMYAYDRREKDTSSQRKGMREKNVTASVFLHTMVVK